MKVEVKEKGSEIKYPCLMKSKDFSSIVLFMDGNNGTCLYQGTYQRTKLGDIGTSYDILDFELFDGEITLKND